MATAPRKRPRTHLASSPFKPDPEPVIEIYSVADRVSHDTFGLGRVVGVDADAVTVDFGGTTTRVPSPFHRLFKLE